MRNEPNKLRLIKLTTSAMLLALGLVLPFLTGQIKQIGKLLLPLHYPAFFTGLLCGAPYGAVVGAVLPILRSILFSKPILFPDALAMAAELAIYGLLSGLLYPRQEGKPLRGLFPALGIAMVGGRIALGIAKALLLGFGENGFTFRAFFTVSVLETLPGVAIQLVLLPLLMLALHKAKILSHFSKKDLSWQRG